MQKLDFMGNKGLKEAMNHSCSHSDKDGSQCQVWFRSDCHTIKNIGAHRLRALTDTIELEYKTPAKQAEELEDIMRNGSFIDDEGDRSFLFNLDGYRVCPKMFLAVTGYSRNAYYKIRKDFVEGNALLMRASSYLAS